MPPDGYNSSTVSDGVMEQLVVVMTEYDCDCRSDAIETATTIAFERDEAEPAGGFFQISYQIDGTDRGAVGILL